MAEVVGVDISRFQDPKRKSVFWIDKQNVADQIQGLYALSGERYGMEVGSGYNPLPGELIEPGIDWIHLEASNINYGGGRRALGSSGYKHFFNSDSKGLFLKTFATREAILNAKTAVFRNPDWSSGMFFYLFPVRESLKEGSRLVMVVDSVHANSWEPAKYREFLEMHGYEPTELRNSPHRYSTRKISTGEPEYVFDYTQVI